MKTQFYLVSSEYVGPNKKDSAGKWLSDDTTIMYIQTQPGTTNMSHENRTVGWLGTTNDTSEHAYGEFSSIEEAREKAHEMGYTHEMDLDGEDLSYGSEDNNVYEAWISESAACEQWDAGDWFDGLGRAGTVSEYGITTKTTDEEISGMVERAEKEAREDNVELHETDEFFTELRNELIEDED